MLDPVMINALVMMAVLGCIIGIGLAIEVMRDAPLPGRQPGRPLPGRVAAGGKGRRCGPPGTGCDRPHRYGGPAFSIRAL